MKDTGIGIPKDRQEVIFERFIQADVSDKKALQGAGLGLSIAKGYVEILGGKIRVESEEGKGSVFYFTIPYMVEMEQKPDIHLLKSTEGPKNPIKSLKILVAEDDEISDRLITVVLKKAKHVVLHAKNGSEALNLVRNNPDFDLIMMDIQLPEINGYEVTRQIRQFNKKVIIIAQTAYGLTGDREKAIEAGCNDYMSKPLTPELILDLINKHL